MNNLKGKLINILITIILLHFSFRTDAQNSNFKAMEVSYLSYQFALIQYDVDENWLGYNLPNNENGANLNFSYGKIMKEKLFFSLGLGYLNFESIHGAEIFSNLRYLVLNRKLSPLINWRVGYNHIWNQYEGGKGRAFTDFGAGFNLKFNKKISISLQSGFLFSQQALFVPARLGLNF